nr:putative ribonuclease H-like domain-containing protein [Tanacetum cinerariifolium]
MLRGRLLASFQDLEHEGGDTRSQGDIRFKDNDAISNACTQDNVDAGKEVSEQHHIVLPLWSSISSTYKSSDDKAEDDKPKDDTGSKTVVEPINKKDQAYKDELDRLMSQKKEASNVVDSLSKEFEQGCMDQRGAAKAGSTNSFNIISNPVNVASTLKTFSAGEPSSPHPDAFILDDTLLHVDQDDSQIPYLEDTIKLRSIGIFTSAYDDDLDTFTSPVQSMGAEADFNNMESSTIVSLIPTHRVHIDHPKDKILRDLHSAVQTRGMEKKSSGVHAFVSYIHKQRRTNHKDYENCLFACFLLQMEPKKVAQALDDESWVEAMQDELLKFSLQKVWRLVDLPYGKKVIGTKWVYRNKKDERGIVVRNKSRLVAQRHRQEEGIDYDDVFAPVAKIEAIKIFLAFASFIRFIVYQMDVKSAFLYGIIEEKVYVSQPPGFIDPQFPNKVYKVEKDLYGLHQAPRACTPIETQKPLVKDEEAADVDVHLYRSMIVSLMYLTASRPDIMFVVYACSRFHVTLKLLHLHVVKRIFRYLKGQPKLGLWYPRDSPFDLEAYSYSDYAGANLDRKSTTRGCQFLGKRLISWQCKKQTIVATSTTEAEYVAAANCCGQIHATVDGKTVVITKSSVRRDLLFTDDNGITCLTNAKIFENLPLIGEDRMEHAIKLTDPVPQAPHDSPLSGGHTPGSDEGSMTLKELTDLCTTLSQKVLDLEKVFIHSKLVPPGDTVWVGGITAETVSTAKPDISATRPKVSTAEPQTPPTITKLFNDEDVTIADTLVKMKIQKAKEKGVALKDVDDSARPIRSITTLQPLSTINLKDKDLDEKVRAERERQEEASKAALAELYDEVGSEEDEKRVKSRKKREAGSSSKQNSPKKQKVNDQEYVDSDKELRKCLKVLGTMEAGDVHVYKLSRLDGSYRHFSTFSRMLEVLDRQDVLDLHKIVMERFPANDPEEKRYPLTKEILKKMLSWRLEAKIKRNYIPPKPNLMFIDEQVESEYVDVISNVASSDVKTVESKHESIDVKNKGVYSTVKTKLVMKNNFSPPIIKDYNFDDESEVEFEPKVEVKTVRPSIEKIKFVKTAKEIEKETNAILLIMKIMMVDLFLLEMVKAAFPIKKGKQHKASYKAKIVNSISKPLHMLHMDLFGPINVKSLMKKSYYLVVTNDFSRFYWVFFLATKDETSGILKTFITRRENQLDCKVKVIRCDNETEFKNSVMNQFCDMKGTKREFSVGRTPQQIGVAERKNRTLIEAVRTLLVDSKLPTTFWAEEVNIACYVLNRALVIKPHNKTPYELIRRRPPLIDFIKPFGYSVVSKAMRVFDKRTRIVEETLNIRFLENVPNVKRNGPDWLFDIDYLTISMNYEPVVAGKQTNGITGTKDNIVVGPKDSAVDATMKATEVDESRVSDNGGHDDQVTRSEFEWLLQQDMQTEHINSTNSFNTVVSPVNTVGPSFANTASPSQINAAGTPASTNEFEEHPFKRFSPFENAFSLPHVPIMTPINDTKIFSNAYDDEAVKEEVEMNNMVSSYAIPNAPLTKFLKDHPKD